MVQQTNKPKVSEFKPKKSTLIWDGDCGFCKYWVLRMQKVTPELAFVPYQEIHTKIKGISKAEFQSAAWLIEKDGHQYSGAASIYRVLWYSNRKLPFVLYEHFSKFAIWSELAYNVVAKNRPVMFRLTKLFFGSEPTAPRSFWKIYLVAILVGVILIRRKTR